MNKKPVVVGMVVAVVVVLLLLLRIPYYPILEPPVKNQRRIFQ
jgi:hypothetical protein